MSFNDNLRLESLKLDAGEYLPPLSPNRNTFSLSVPYSTTEVSLSCQARNPAALMSIGDTPLPSDQMTGPFALETGVNPIKVSVNAPGESETLTYTVKVLRAQEGLNWKQLLEHAPFPERDSAGGVVFQNRMWVLGGFLPELVDDVWSSSDGINWQFEGHIGAPSGLNIPVTFVYQDKMWVSSVAGELFSSADGKQWDLVNAAPPWGKRYAPGFTVFQDRMWVLGGREESAIYNDAWSSQDGIHWTHEYTSAPWSPRQLFSNVIVKDEKLWIIGGGIAKYEPFRSYQDVWCSADGVHWEQVLEEAPWEGRVWSNCIVYRDRMFLLGGFRAQPHWENFGDVWYSTDGKAWNQLHTEACWSARHELSAYVFQDKLWVIAGNPWPLFNDVWALEIPGLCFLSQPVLEQHAGTLYRYKARADFNKSLHPVHYRLTIAADWLAVNEMTGVVRGLTPNEGGVFPIALEAFDAAGEIARQEYTLHVDPAYGS